jgi:hypothetical protein
MGECMEYSLGTVPVGKPRYPNPNSQRQEGSQ